MTDRHLVDLHVLLVRWYLPSGKLDAGESLLAVAVREVEEEVGLLVDPVDLRQTRARPGPGRRAIVKTCG